MKKKILFLLLLLGLAFSLQNCKSNKRVIKKGKPIPCPIKDC